MRKATLSLLFIVTAYFLVVAAAQAEPMLTNILDTLYGANNWSQYNGPDEVWFNLNGHSEAVVRYAGYTQLFGYIRDKDNDGLYEASEFDALFNVTTTTPSGYFTDGQYQRTLSVGPYYFVWADDPSGSPMWTSIANPNDHMKTFYITGGLDKGKYVIAWEDLNLGDADYNDLVVEVYAVTPVPEPGTLALLGTGLLGLGGIGLYRRRRN